LGKLNRLNDLATEKNAKILFLIGIICLILSPILGMAAAKIPVYEEGFDAANGNKKTIYENSTNSLSECYVLQFSLGKDQVCYAELSVPYLNSSVNIIFFSAAEFNTEAAKEDPPGTLRAPNAGWGISFLDSIFDAYATPNDNGATTLAVGQGEYHYLEFMGAGTGDNIWTMPGDYVVLIWGSNSGSHPDDELVSFDIIVSIEGPGDLLSTIFSAVGFIVLTIVGLIAIAILLDKARVRRR